MQARARSTTPAREGFQSPLSSLCWVFLARPRALIWAGSPGGGSSALSWILPGFGGGGRPPSAADQWFPFSGRVIKELESARAVPARNVVVVEMGSGSMGALARRGEQRRGERGSGTRAAFVLVLDSKPPVGYSLFLSRGLKTSLAWLLIALKELKLSTVRK